MGPKRIKLRYYYHTSRNPQEFLDKKYDFSENDGNKTIPNDMYVSEKWSLPELQSRKTYLNSVKEKLSEFNLQQWSNYTKWRDPSTTILHTIRTKYAPELLTQAWCKFYEILSKFNVIPRDFSGDTLRSLHLCEAPGGFISSLNHYLYEKLPDVKLEWIGNSLNPYYEGTPLIQMIPDDRLIRKTMENWNFGLDFTGDVTVFYNHEYLVETTTKNGKMHLVTADGSVNCMLNPGDQEISVEYLHYCETMTALSVLENDGSFILKIFTMFEESTVCLLLFLNATFKKVSIFKPCTSKSGNSELYVICLCYKGFHTFSSETWACLKRPYKAGKLKHSMFLLDEIQPGFIQEIFECCDLFGKFQIATIEANINDFLSEQRENLKGTNDYICRWFESIYKMKGLPNERRLVKDCDISIFPKKNLPSINRVHTKFSFDNDINTLDIKIGKKIDIVYNSQFCEQNLMINLLHLDNLKNSPLINSLLTILCRNNNIISYFDLRPPTESFGDFQITFFKTIHRNIKENTKDIVLYKIPFVTHFIVSILYILQKAFDFISFTDPGIIYLNSYNEVNMKIVLVHFDLIDEELTKSVRCINYCFNASLCSILDFRKINKAFLEQVWMYNDNFLKSIKNDLI